MSFAIPMLILTTGGLVGFIAALLCGSGTKKGREPVPGFAVA